MEWLNYHHLLYFWTVAKEGSIARACVKLRLAQPTIYGQIRQLEDSLGEKLFAKAGRGLVLTEIGQVVYRYAEEIFGLGHELQNVLRGGVAGRSMRLMVGVSDMVPKLVAHRILMPALAMPEPVRLVCEEDSPQRLLADLAEHKLDVVLSEVPVTSLARVKGYNHLLGTTGITLFGAPALAGRLRRGFPSSLDGAPFLMPVDGSGLRRSLEQWMSSAGIRPVIAGEFKDSALMKAFGQAGAGVFGGPTAIEREIRDHYAVEPIGVADGVAETFYAISGERRLKHPAVLKIIDLARGKLFNA